MPPNNEYCKQKNSFTSAGMLCSVWWGNSLCLCLMLLCWSTIHTCSLFRCNTPQVGRHSIPGHLSHIHSHFWASYCNQFTYLHAFGHWEETFFFAGPEKLVFKETEVFTLTNPWWFYSTMNQFYNFLWFHGLESFP